MLIVIISFLLSLAAFTAVGILSASQKQNTTEDYLVAGRNTSPWLTGLSAVATMNSGYMFIGVIGFTYTVGVSAIWLMLGWICGDYVAWRLVYPRVREQTGKLKLNSMPSFLGATREGPSRLIMALTGAVTVLGLGAYAGAQFNAGSKALHALFGWPYATGAVIGALIVVVYCFSGGLRASIWTDAAQSVVMMVGMITLVFACALKEGGPVALFEKLHAIDPSLTRLVPEDLRFGFLLWAVGWVFAGFAVVGQPHVMIRPMAIRSAKEMKWARRTYFAWYIPFYATATLVSLYARLLIPDVAAFDAELALPTISMELLPSVAVGVVLAGLFAATMSTADSQVIACSASLTQDIAPRWRDSYTMSKVGTVAVAIVALLFALLGTKSVFGLVLAAWSILAASLGPLLVVRALRLRAPTPIAVLMVVVGLVVAMLWKLAGLGDADGDGLYEGIYEIMPGMVSGFVVYGLWRLAQRGTAREAARPVPGTTDAGSGGEDDRSE